MKESLPIPSYSPPSPRREIWPVRASQDVDHQERGITELLRPGGSESIFRWATRPVPNHGNDNPDPLDIQDLPTGAGHPVPASESKGRFTTDHQTRGRDLDRLTNTYDNRGQVHPGSGDAYTDVGQRQISIPFEAHGSPHLSKRQHQTLGGVRCCCRRAAPDTPNGPGGREDEPE
ncbi:hypothetical protein NDU88_002733 [Pleurodeles waltl]|uniref:Uncharacterized protein n=1 Tax=Pleurodeles waltl TaxID=8319 RepID=A0AAV7T393_PLEWA|nr:hypothetical protein NDU88_002733 [Pleurodeles waltl]